MGQYYGGHTQPTPFAQSTDLDVYVRTASVTLNTAQIIAASGTPHQLVAAVAGNAIVPLVVIAEYTGDALDAHGSGTMGIKWGNLAVLNMQSDGAIASSSDYFAWTNIQSITVLPTDNLMTAAENVALNIDWNPTVTNVAAGDRSVKVTVKYILHPITV